MNTFTKALLASVIAMLAYPVIAAGPASAPRNAQQDMTQAQFMKFTEERFDALDVNKDGKVTKEERAAQRQGRGMGPSASMPDTMTKAEHMKMAQERFAAMDVNKDGKITKDERGGKRDGKRGDKHGGKKADKRGDRGMEVGTTRDQHMKMSQERFDAKDVNKNGKIDAEEVGRRGGKQRSGQGQGQGRGMPQASMPVAK